VRLSALREEKEAHITAYKEGFAVVAETGKRKKKVGGERKGNVRSTVPSDDPIPLRKRK